jgi:hypothetical protein
MPKNPYPQHARLKEVKDKTQFVHDFFTLLQDNGYHLVKVDDSRGLSSREFDDSLYTFIGVDRWKLEDEKRAMLGHDPIPKGGKSCRTTAKSKPRSRTRRPSSPP